MAKGFQVSKLLLSFLGWITILLVNAQNINETHWYFGNSPYGFTIDKSGRNANLRSNQATPFGQGGSAVINDKFKGNIRFYTDGQLVYDASHQLLPGIAGGTLLNGDPSLSNPVLACPFPDNSDQFYLFTNNTTSIEYSVIDGSIQGNSGQAQLPYGDLTTFNQPTGLSNPSEAMLLVPSADRQQYFLITQDRSTFDFRVTTIGAAGITNTDSYSIFPAAIPGFETIQMAFNEDSTSIAVAPKRADRNVFLMDIDLNTGALTFNRRILNTGFSDIATPVLSDVEWSGDGTKLYISRAGDNTALGNIYQIDLADSVNVNPPVLPILSTGVFRSYGLKRGIDGKIYHLYQQAGNNDPFLLGRINRPDSTAAADVLYDSLFFEENFNGRQFPEFAPSYLPLNFFTLSFDYFDSCEFNATHFFAQVMPKPNNFFWDFGDGTFGEGPAPIHTYDNRGGYAVSLIVEHNGYIQQSNPQTVSILEGDSTLDLGNDTTICVDEVLPLKAGNQYINYVWSTGVSGPTDSIINVDTAGTYWVEVTTANGCTSFDDIVVTEYGVTTQVGNQWYFGERAGLNFNDGAPVPITDDNVMFSAAGCASISDENGQLLFYTNGNTVWNRKHEVMKNGNDLGGDDIAVQSSLILPFSDDNTMFYIFTTEEVYGNFQFDLKMSVVDMKQDASDGQVMIKGLPITTCSSEKLSASGYVGTPYLLAKEFGNNSFSAFQVDPNGIGNPIYSAVGEDHSFQNEINGSGQMKFAPGAGLVAVPIPGDPNQVELFSFDVTTGELSNPVLINIQEPAPAVLYGLEFSGDGSKLYVTTTGTNSKLIQFDLDSITTTYIEASKFDGFGALANGYGSMQRGPDGVIYLAVDNAPTLGTISVPGAEGTAATFTEDGQDLAGRISRLGLPNFTQQLGSSLQQPSISTDVACAGQETSFSAVGRDSSIEEYYWDFGDMTGEIAAQDTTHIYTTPGSYTVTLRLSNRCDADSLITQVVDVFSIPETPMVPEDTALCGNPVTLMAWDINRPDFNYYWSTGDTTRTITITPAQIGSGIGIIDVAIINNDGCSSDTVTVFIADQNSIIDLGNDRVLCQNDTAIVLDSNDPGPDYIWTRDGEIIGTNRTQTVSTATAGLFSYVVSVTDEFTGCTFRDTVGITVLPAPSVVLGNVVNPECGQPTGTLDFDVLSSGSFSYEVTGPVNAGPFTIDGPATTPALTNLPAGSYVANVTNTVTGCSSTEVIQLEDNAPFNIVAEPFNDCVLTSDILVRFESTLPAGVEINVLDRFGINVFSESTPITTRTYIINDLDTGTYFVQVQDQNPPNCIQTDTVRLQVSTECYRRIFAPNAFSPNGNGINEEFFVFPNQYIDKFTIYIYNRWGDLVYSSNRKDFRWDGYYQNQLVPPGLYAYRMVFTSTLEPEQGNIQQFGSITVVK